MTNAVLIHIGFGNMLNRDKVIAIVNPNSAPVRRNISECEANNKLVNATGGRKAKSAIVASGRFIILSALSPETIQGRVKVQKEENGH